MDTADDYENNLADPFSHRWSFGQATTERPDEPSHNIKWPKKVYTPTESPQVISLPRKSSEA